MYGDTGFIYPYFQSFSQEVQPFDELCGFQKLDISMSNLFSTSAISKYDLGGEGDLFKAPEPIIEEPIIEEPLMSFDPRTAAFSMISCGEDVLSPETIQTAEVGMTQSKPILNEVFYESEKDLLTNSAIANPFSGVPDVKVPVMQVDEDPTSRKDMLISQAPVQKSVSSGCLSSMEWISANPVRPNFLDFHGVDFSAAYGMRRAFSEGDMQTLTSGGSNIIHSSAERGVTIGNYTVEERLQMLSRYRKKKTKRNFGRTIKYACRKALADNQPRVRGRFAKTEESDIPKK